MANVDIVKEALNEQQRHWEKKYQDHPDMFGKDASYPALKAAELFAHSKAKKILELGSGQGREIEHLAKGYEIFDVEEFEETNLPKRLFLVTLKKT